MPLGSAGGLPVPQGAPKGGPAPTPALMQPPSLSILGYALNFGVGVEHLGPSRPREWWWIQTSLAAFLLSPRTQALAISDHFPVEVILKAR